MNGSANAPAKTIVITGGTDGMGRELARIHLDRGDTVVVVGRDAAKAAGLPGAEFIAADLSLVSENLRVLEQINARYPVVDALVLCARYFRSTRFVTAEGVEGTFALEYLSRFLLGHGLNEPGVIVNVSGPGVPMGRIHWDDLMLERGYEGVAAQMQAGRANDLLGVDYAARHAARRTSYVLINPGPVATSFAGEYDAATAAHVADLKRHGRPVRDGVEPIGARIDAPPTAPLTAFARFAPIGLDDPSFDPDAAGRLHDLTRRLLHRLGH
ncbi:oxidoreductase [Actinomadura sp. CNU-125]|uniref:SDR family NAD(P)-dependent oxidoreductase n=1 Tax=Actinomadura sp. CNU-125 TaxID=1904961 RepID=UPI00095E3920|nr:SDR family NAD(P)-dependent oxidoreductase [Actinomadura sp. CNU-125]OLT19390.1 oxidoreductase [Actinomadura sp. CNU-125]